VFNPLSEAVTFATKEQVSAAIDKEGNVKSFEVKGQLTMTINDPSKGQIAVLVQKNEKYGSLMKVPPQFNKGTWGSESVLMPRDEKSSFPTTTAIPAIKYTVSDSKGEFMPFNINVWFTEGTLTLETELNEKQNWLTELKDIKILVPSKDKKYKVNSIENSKSEASTDGEGISMANPSAVEGEEGREHRDRLQGRSVRGGGPVPDQGPLREQQAPGGAGGPGRQEPRSGREPQVPSHQDCRRG
jgi:hypothetical protein